MRLQVETSNLSKYYPRVRAVDQLSLCVAEGQIYAFLGLNGAGKTTTIRMLLGMIKPTSGNARVLQTSVRPGDREPWARVGYLVEAPHAYPELSVYENLEAARRLHPGTPPQAVRKIIEQLNIVAYCDRPAGTLSQGNKQRLGLAKALLHEPKLLILDEPANGLDPAGIVEIRNLLTTLAHEQGVTVFMSSHNLAEVARLADRIGIIHQGRLLQEFGLEELEDNRRRRLLVRTQNPVASRAAVSAAGYQVDIQPDGMLELKNTKSIEHPEAIVVLLVQAGFPPSQVMTVEEPLEQYFLRLVGMDGDDSDEQPL